MTTWLDTIWLRVCQNDVEAWDQLVERYAGLVYTVALKCGLPADDAQDCAQETWLALYKRRDRIHTPDALPAWLVKSTRFNANRIYRKQSSQSRAERSAPERLEPEEADAQIMAAQRLAQMELAFEKLEPRCRKLLGALFSESEELSYREVALKLEISLNSIGPIRKRCLEKLKRILQEMGVDRT